MRRESEFPRRRVWRRVSGRAVIIVLGLLLFGVAVFGRAMAQFYIDALWHQSLDRSDIFWGQIWAKVTLFAIFFVVFLVVAGINLYLADQSAPVSFPANVHPFVERFHEVFGHRLRIVRYGTALVLAFFLALPAVSQWRDWLLFRHSRSFGVSDPQFGVDVSFYVFELPFLSFAVDWLFAALVIVLILTVAAHLLNGGVLFTSSMPTVRPATKIHVAALLAVLAAVKAADYWLARYELTTENRGLVQGATYTVVNAQLPALMLLVLIALLTSALYLVTIRTDRWRIPIVSSALWLVVLTVGGIVYPSLVQSLVVRPNQEEREAPYIARNVEATRAAMNIEDVTTEFVEFRRLTTADVMSDIAPFQNVRLLNPQIMLGRFSFDRGEVAGLQIDDLDINRQVIDGRREQTLIAARELDIDHIPNPSWQGRHLVSTRGCGLIAAPVSEVTESDRPNYFVPELERPELYFSPALSGYAVAGTRVTESVCEGRPNYQGGSGVPMGGLLRRAAFALAFLDYNLVASGAIEDDSEVLWVRSVQDRVEKLAPFLDYDGDPYPVVVNGGVSWVIDAYTSTSRYPYAQRIGDVQLSQSTGLSRDANYIRNSVKAVVDAYTGDVTFYVVDPLDPILQVWWSAFPDLFTPIEEMPDELRENLRYPEDLFRVQTELYSKYQIPPENFFQRIGAWSVAQAPSVEPRNPSTGTTTTTTQEQSDTNVPEFATESGTRRFVPYYTLFRNSEGVEEFVLLRPFVPFSRDDLRTELQAYMTASSEPDTYGKLVTYVVRNEPLPAGPLRVVDQAESEQDISREITLQNNEERGATVQFGDLQILPVADGLVYVRPFYVVVNRVAEYRYVIVSHNNNAAFACDLGTALAELFPGFTGTIGDRVDDEGRPLRTGECERTGGSSGVDDRPGTEEPGSDEGTAPDDSPGELPDDATALELLEQAEELFGVADGLLRSGDLGGYQRTMDEAATLVERALDLLQD
jgi:uncharacterized membrane protein (UPF0182 family)